MNGITQRIDTAFVALQGARSLLEDVLSSEAGLLSAVLKQRAAAVIEEHIDPAIQQVDELSALTEAEAGTAFLRQLGACLEDLQRAGGDVATLLEAAYGASVGGDVEAIRKTVRTLTGQVSAITSSLPLVERSPGSGAGEDGATEGI